MMTLITGWLKTLVDAAKQHIPTGFTGQVTINLASVELRQHFKAEREDVR